MPQIASLAMETAYGIAGAGTPYIAAGGTPLFETGKSVWLLSDILNSTNSGVKNAKYTVKGFYQQTADNGGTEAILDQRLDAANSASVGTPTGVTGWDHFAVPGTPGSTVTNDSGSSAYFYVIENEAGNFQTGIHESQLTDEAGYETYAAANISNYIG